MSQTATPQLTVDDELIGRLVVEAELVSLVGLVRCIAEMQADQEKGILPCSLLDVLIEEGLLHSTWRKRLERTCQDIRRRAGKHSYWNASLADLLEHVSEEEAEQAAAATERARKKEAEAAKGQTPLSPLPSAPPPRPAPRRESKGRFMSVQEMLKAGREKSADKSSDRKTKTDSGRVARFDDAGRKTAAKTDDRPTSESGKGPPPVAPVAVRTAKPSPRSRGTFRPSYARKEEKTDHDVDAEKLREELGLAPSQKPKKDDAEQQLKKFVQRFLRGRSYQQALEYIQANGIRYVDPVGLARATGLKEKQVGRILDHWVATGLLRATVRHPYAFIPKAPQVAQIKLFFEHWRRSDWRPKIIAMLLENEK